MKLDPLRLKKDFPVLAQEVRGRPLVYLDSAATSQKPLCVIQALERFYIRDNANVHRAVHALAERATTAFEGARRRIARGLGHQRFRARDGLAAARSRRTSAR